VSGAYVFALLAARPHRYRAQWLAMAVPNAIAFGLALASAGAVQYAIIQRLPPAYDLLSGLAIGAQGLAFVQAIYDMTVQAQDLVAAWRGRTLWRYVRRKTRSIAAQDCAAREDNATPVFRAAASVELHEQIPMSTPFREMPASGTVPTTTFFQTERSVFYVDSPTSNPDFDDLPVRQRPHRRRTGFESGDSDDDRAERLRNLLL
jgi:hypothetical protein